MKKFDIFKIAGLVATIGGFAMTMLGNWASEQQRSRELDEKVTEKLSEMLKDMSD